MRFNEINESGSQAQIDPAGARPLALTAAGGEARIVRVAPTDPGQMPSASKNCQAGSLDGRIVKINVVTSLAEYSASHGLGRIPVGFIPINVPSAGHGVGDTMTFRRGSTAWTGTTMTITPIGTIGSTTAVTFLVF